MRELEENLEEEDVKLIEAMRAAAVDYCVGQTGLTKEELDKHESVTIAVLVLISDMWDNRSITIDRSNPNDIVENILYMHSRNLLPSPDAEV